MEKRTYAASDQAKHALAQALKTLMTQKPFDRITIQDITELCGIRRQHFYYHFQDIYDLLRWMFQEEAVSLLHQHEGALLWQDGLLQLFHYIEANRAVCLCALNSVGRDCLKRFFEADIYYDKPRLVQARALYRIHLPTLIWSRISILLPPPGLLRVGSRGSWTKVLKR